MDYDIKVYVDGRQKGHMNSNLEFDLVYLGRITDRLNRKYRMKGYTEVKNCYSPDGGYSLMFNEKLMKSVVISYEKRHLLDFTDSAGNRIERGKVYRGELQGEKISKDHSYDRYIVTEGLKGKLYIRNLTRSNQCVVWDSHPHMCKTVQDKYDFDQKYIDSLKLQMECGV